MHGRTLTDLTEKQTTEPLAPRGHSQSLKQFSNNSSLEVVALYTLLAPDVHQTVRPNGIWIV